MKIEYLRTCLSSMQLCRAAFNSSFPAGQLSRKPTDHIKKQILTSEIKFQPCPSLKNQKSVFHNNHKLFASFQTEIMKTVTGLRIPS